MWTPPHSVESAGRSDSAVGVYPDSHGAGVPRRGVVLEGPGTVALHHGSGRRLWAAGGGVRGRDVRLGHDSRDGARREYTVEDLAVPEGRAVHRAREGVGTKGRGAGG